MKIIRCFNTEDGSVQVQVIPHPDNDSWVRMQAKDMVASEMDLSDVAFGLEDLKTFIDLLIEVQHNLERE